MCSSDLVLAKDMLFATLDPTMRGLKLPSGRRIILSDTVGFIADLPTQLVAAFRATLEEVLEADIILHVRDLAHEETEAQRRDVLKVLKDLGVDPDNRGDARPIFEVHNKIDLLEPEVREALLARNRIRPADGLAVSALTGEGLASLLTLVDDSLGAEEQSIAVTIPIGDGAASAWAYRHGRVAERHDGAEATRLVVAVDPPQLERFVVKFGGAVEILRPRQDLIHSSTKR